SATSTVSTAPTTPAATARPRYAGGRGRASRARRSAPTATNRPGRVSATATPGSDATAYGARYWLRRSRWAGKLANASGSEPGVTIAVRARVLWPPVQISTTGRAPTAATAAVSATMRRVPLRSTGRQTAAHSAAHPQRPIATTRITAADPATS